jgi:hypothetical protein
MPASAKIHKEISILDQNQELRFFLGDAKQSHMRPVAHPVTHESKRGVPPRFVFLLKRRCRHRRRDAASTLARYFRSS